MAAELGCLKTVLHPSYIMGLGIFVMDQAREYALESLVAIMEKADQLDLLICLENLFPRAHSLVEPEDFADTFVKFPNLKMTLDTGHANLGENGSTRLGELVERFGERIGHVHLSDNRGHHDEHLPLGFGTIDFRRLAKELHNVGYEGTLTFEVFDEDRRLLVESRRYWRQLLDTST